MEVQENKDSKVVWERFDKITMVAIGLVILSSLICLQFYYNERINSCTKSPLQYASQYYEETYGYETYGYLHFIIPDKDIKPVTLYFNKEKVNVDNKLEHTNGLNIFPINITLPSN